MTFPTTTTTTTTTTHTHIHTPDLLSPDLGHPHPTRAREGSGINNLGAGNVSIIFLSVNSLVWHPWHKFIALNRLVRCCCQVSLHVMLSDETGQTPGQKKSNSGGAGVGGTTSIDTGGSLADRGKSTELLLNRTKKAKKKPKRLFEICLDILSAMQV